MVTRQRTSAGSWADAVTGHRPADRRAEHRPARGLRERPPHRHPPAHQDPQVAGHGHASDARRRDRPDGREGGRGRGLGGGLRDLLIAYPAVDDYRCRRRRRPGARRRDRAGRRRFDRGHRRPGRRRAGRRRPTSACSSISTSASTAPGLSRPPAVAGPGTTRSRATRLAPARRALLLSRTRLVPCRSARPHELALIDALLAESHRPLESLGPRSHASSPAARRPRPTSRTWSRTRPRSGPAPTSTTT